MGWIIGIAILLSALCMLGVIYVVVEFIKQLIDKKELEEKYQKLCETYDRFVKTTNEKLDVYEEKISKLDLNASRYFDVLETEQSKTIHITTQISDKFKKLLAMNERLYNKVRIIDEYLSESSPNHALVADLVCELRLDIEEQQHILEIQKEEQALLREEFLNDVQDFGKGRGI